MRRLMELPLAVGTLAVGWMPAAALGYGSFRCFTRDTVGGDILGCFLVLLFVSFFAAGLKVTGNVVHAWWTGESQ